MNSLVPSSYLVKQSYKTVYQRVMSLVSALLNTLKVGAYTPIVEV